MSGLFITFEGGEGSGKTTIAKLIKDYLEKEGYLAIAGKEFSGRSTGYGTGSTGYAIEFSNDVGKSQRYCIWRRLSA